MRYLSLFSGIEAATVAWHPLGWECVAVAEIEPFPASVLAHHYPAVPNLGDVTAITSENIEALGQIDLVVFGSPCQDLSVAGKRLGFDGARSGLFTTAINIVRWAREHCGCRFALWENVPGAFSSNQGRDFAVVVEQMAGCRDVAVPKNGWGTEGVALGDDGLLEWSTLDAQWFGVAQRRRRVFAVADFGDWANRPPILLEPDSLRGDTAPRRKTGEEVAGAFAGRDGAIGFSETDKWPAEIACTLNASFGSKQGIEDQHINGGDPLFVPVLCVHGTQDPDTNINLAHTLGRNQGQENAVLAFQPGNLTRCAGASPSAEVLPTLMAGHRRGASDQDPHVLTGMAVRRLTPTECERLQGFPDGYTDIPWNSAKEASRKGISYEAILALRGMKLRGPNLEECPDGPRYKALGNSMAVPVMRWIGQQINSSLIADKMTMQ